jgi:DNA polymerase elongation subunit (family B)
MNLTNIINGKKQVERLVSIEPQNDSVELFFENPDGSISSKVEKNKYWILSNQSHGKEFNRLKGDLFYCWGKQYSDRIDFLKERKKFPNTFSIFNEKESCAVKDGWACFLGMDIPEVSLLSFDLETTTLDPKDPIAKILLISTYYRNKHKVIKRLFSYENFNSQADMLNAFCKHVRDTNPTLLIGHNIFGFDLNYMETIADNEGISLLLGRDGSAMKSDSYEKKFRVDGNRDLHYRDFRIYGREIIDTMFLSIKADIDKKYNSYGLKPIIKQENWELSNRTFYDASTIRFNYKNPVEWEKIKAYCEDDAIDAVTLYDKFVPPFFYMNRSVAKGSFQTLIQSATGSQLNSIMLRAYLQDGHSLPKADEQAYFEGAISEGNPGIYNNCMKLDVSSLYPSIMVEYNIYPAHKDPNEYFPALVKYFRTERLANKKLAKETGNAYYNHLEQSQKIAINSLYGFMGAPGLLFNHIQGAGEVTKKGREILQKGMKHVTENFQMIIANVDTDSILFGYKDGCNIEETEREFIRQSTNKLFPSTISWEHDGYYKKVIILKAKNYVLDDGKKVKYKGSSLRSPTLEEALREFIHEIVNAILTDKTNYSEIYNKYVKEIDKVDNIKRWASRKTISDKTLSSERTNEVRIVDAIEGTEYVEGDRIWVYFKSDGSLSLVDTFNGEYNKKKLYEKLFKTGQRFSTVFPNSKEIFPNLALKKNAKLLEKTNEVNL